MQLRVGHVSLEYRDSDKQHTADIEKIFDRAEARRLAWLTGTEAGPGSGNTGDELIRVALQHGYRPMVPSLQVESVAQHTDCWIAVRSDLICGDWDAGFKLVIPGSAQVKKSMKIGRRRWGPRGLVYVSFDSTNVDLGRVSIGSAHYLTGARTPRSKFWKYNERLGQLIGEWATEEGKGHALVFYGGDQNMLDKENKQPQGDTFFGSPLTSTWDELRKWENTGHGAIDIIASYNRDRRVRALHTNALSDREFHLHTDHRFVEGTFFIDPLPR